MRIQLICVALGVCQLGFLLYGGEVAVEQMADTLVVEARYRNLGTAESDNLIQKLFSESAAQKWECEIKENFSPEQLADFFSGALLFQGEVNRRGSIFAFYNCWWDAIFLFEGYYETVKVNENNLSILKVGDFLFCSGEQFSEDDSADAIAQDASLPLIIKVMQKLKNREAHFQKIYMSSKGALLLLPKNFSEEENIRQLQQSSAIRLKQFSLCWHDEARLKESIALENLLASGPKKRFSLYFTDKLSQMMIESFVQYPVEWRSKFRLYGYWAGENSQTERDYLFIHRQMPRYVAMIHIRPGLDGKSFYFLDINNYQDLLKLAETVKQTAAEEKSNE